MRSASIFAVLAANQRRPAQVRQHHLVAQSLRCRASKMRAGSGGDRPSSIEHCLQPGASTSTGSRRVRKRSSCHARRLRIGREAERHASVARQRDEVGELRRSAGTTPGRRSSDRHAHLEAREVQLHRLRNTREVRHAQDRFALVLAQRTRAPCGCRARGSVIGAAAERLVAACAWRSGWRVQLSSDAGSRVLRLDVHRLVAVHRDP